MKRELFFAHVYFSNETVSQTTVSTGPMKMFRLKQDTISVGHLILRALAIQASDPQNALAHTSFHSPKGLVS